METNDILMVVGILAIILFLVSVGMSYKSWRAHTLILVFLVFCAAGTQFVLAAYVLKTQQSWQEIIYGVRKPDKEKRSDGLKVDIEKLEQENIQLQGGEWVDGILVKDGIDQTDARVGAVTLDRGSIWKNCIPTNAQAGGTVDLKIPNPEGRQLWKNMLVYAFEGTEIAEGGQYLGEFRVDKVTISDEAAAEGDGGPTFTTVSLVPSLPLAAEELVRLSKSQDNWTIYDRMPVDNHYIFAEVEDRSKWLPETSVAEYDKDLQPADENDPAERIEVLVRFLQDYESEVPILVRKPGQEAGEDPEEIPVTFEKNQLAWIGKETVTAGDRKILGADDLAEAGIVNIRTKVRSNFDSGIKLPGYPAPQGEDDITQIDAPPRYVRPLRNYRTLFGQIRANRVSQQEAAEKIETQTTQLGEDNEDAEASLAALQATIGRLEADAAQHANEEKVVKAHLAALDKQYKRLQATRERLFEDNARLAAELDRLEKQAAREIDRRAPASDQTSLIQPASNR